MIKILIYNWVLDDIVSENTEKKLGLTIPYFSDKKELCAKMVA